MLLHPEYHFYHYFVYHFHFICSEIQRTKTLCVHLSLCIICICKSKKIDQRKELFLICVLLFRSIKRPVLWPMGRPADAKK